MVPAKETCSSSIVTCRPSAAARALRCGAGWVEPHDRGIHQPVHTSRVVRCAYGASWVSTYAAASGDRFAWMVVSATRLARHAGRSPACTRPHNRG